MAHDDEQRFLHDISNPLSIIQGNIRIALRRLRDLGDPDQLHSEVAERLDKALLACEKMAKEIVARRDLI